MNKIVLQRQGFLIKVILVSVALFGLHIFLMHTLITATLFYPLWAIYAFHAVTVFSIYSIIHFNYTRGKKNIMYLFILLTSLKMLLSIVFLLPLLRSTAENKQADIFSFFIPYFLFLILETSHISKFLRKA